MVMDNYGNNTLITYYLSDIRDGVQDGRRRIIKFGKSCKQVYFTL